MRGDVVAMDVGRCQRWGGVLGRRAIIDVLRRGCCTSNTGQTNQNIHRPLCGLEVGAGRGRSKERARPAGERVDSRLPRLVLGVLQHVCARAEPLLWARRGGAGEAPTYKSSAMLAAPEPKTTLVS